MIALSYEAMGDLADRVVLACWAHPSGWAWYVVEYHPDEEHPGAPARLAWGLVKGHYLEFGYFDLDELRSVGATPVPGWQAITIGDVLKRMQEQALEEARRDAR